MWETILLILQAFHHDTLEETTQTFRPFHCAVASPVPLALTAFLHPLNPNHLYEKDSKGRLPLGMAEASPHLNRLPNTFVPLLQYLLSLHPEAISIQDWMGKFPLTLAIESGKSWDNGISLLLETEPRVLSTRDELSHFYPFMLASVKD